MKDLDQPPSTERFWYARWRKERAEHDRLRRLGIGCSITNPCALYLGFVAKIEELQERLDLLEKQAHK